MAESAHECDWISPPAQKAFHGLAGEFVRLVEPHSEADPVSLLVQFLVVFGNLAGPNLYRVADGSHHGLNLFAVLVGKSSKSRKGTSWAQVRRFYEMVDKAWWDRHVKNGLSSGEGLIEAVRCIESISSVRGGVEKSLLVTEEEFARVLKVSERKENTLSPVIREAWDSGNLHILTRNSPASVAGGHISIIGHITQLELDRLLNPTEIANGFANRFLWVAVRRSKCLPHGGRPDQDELKSLSGKVKDAVDFARGREVDFSVKAYNLWEKIYPSLSAERDGLVGSIVSRSEAQVLRLACTYAALSCSPEIKTQHVKAGFELWNYCERSVSLIFGRRTGDKDTEIILSALRSEPAGLTRTQINRLFGNNANADRIEHELGALKKSALADCQAIPTGGRPLERWCAVVANHSGSLS